MKVLKRNILLNPGPATTSQTVKEALMVPDICPREKEFGDLMDGIRHDLVKLVHGGNDYVAILFTSSGTGAVESVISSVVPKDKKILIIDNGAYGSRMVKIARTYNIDLIEYQVAYGDYPNIAHIESLLQSDKDIAFIGMVHHETTTGMLNPVKEISQLAHQYGAEMIVDTISSYAGMPINIKELNLEYIVSSSNKCIQGMAGLGFVIAQKKALSKVIPNLRSFYLDLVSQHEYFEKNKQTQFTPPVQVVYALRQAINEFFEEGIDGRFKRYAENWLCLYEGIIQIGFKPLLPIEQESRILTAFCEPDDTNYSFDDMHDYLYERGFTIYPGKGAKEKTFRLSILGDLHKEDIQAFLKQLQEYVTNKRIQF